MNFGIALLVIGVILYIIGNIADAGILYVVASFVLAFSLIFKWLRQIKYGRGNLNIEKRLVRREYERWAYPM